MQSVFRVLVLTDLVDSTRLVTEVGDARAAELNIAVDRICRDLLEARDGLEIDKTDGFLLLFDSGSAALGYALDLHEALAALSEQEGLALKMRVGLHAATVGLRENPPEDVARGAKPIEVEGLAKPLAARVMSLAVGNQVLCTEAVGRAIDGHDDVEWVDHGHWRLKGVAEPIRLLEVGKPGLAPLKPPPDSEKAWRAITGPLGRQRETLRKAWAVPAVKAIVAALALAAVGAGVWRWDQSRIKVTMHPELVWRQGAPDGVGDWNPELSHGYRVTRQGGRVQRVEHVNASGLPLSFEEPKAETWNNSGLPGLSDYDLIYPCAQDGELRLFRALCGGLDPDLAMLRATTLVPRYDDDGRVTEVHSLDAMGKLRQVRKIAHEEDGLRITFQTPAGLPVANSFRPAYEHHRLDERGLVEERIGLNRDGSSSAFPGLGAHAVRYTRDAAGLEIERTLLDRYGEPIAGTEANRIRTLRDDRGLPSRVEGFRGEKPTRYAGCVRRSYDRDDAGRVVRETCQDEAGAPVFDPGHCALRTYRYGSPSLRASCLDPSGSPIPSAAGWATLEIELGDGGRPVEVRYLDAGGAPTQGLVTTTLSYDPRDVGPEHVGSRLVAKWDAHGLLKSLAFFHGDAPQPVSKGFSRFEVERDAAGADIRWQLFGVDGRPVDTRDGVSRLELTRNEDQNVTELRWFDARGEPTAGSLGEHLERVRYRLGQPVEYAFFGVDDEPITAAQGWHRQTAENHDEQGRPLGYSYWGVDGQPIAPDGYHLERFTYNAEGFAESWSYFDTRRQPVVDALGCAVLTQEGGQARGVNITRCYGPDGELMWSPAYQAATLEQLVEGPERYLIRRGVDGEVQQREDTRYDERGLMVARDVFHLASGTTTRMRKAYDDRGHEVRRWYVGEDGELVVGHRGWAERRRTVDERGNPLSEAFFGAEGEPIDVPGFGYHEQRATFDGQDRWLSLETFDAEGNPALDQGTYGQRYTYDARGNLVSATNLLPEGSTHWTRIERSYDHLGRIDGTRVYDADGALMEITEPGTPLHAGWNVDYDPYGRVLGARFVGADDQPRPCPAGFSEVALTWEDEDRTLRVEYRHEGVPVVLSEGAAFPWWGHRPDTAIAVVPMHQETGLLAQELRGMAGLRFELDVQRRIVAATFLGADGAPMSVDGVAGYTQAWDGFDRVAEVRWVGPDGAPTTHDQLGWAIQKLAYDGADEVAEELLLDPDGAPI